MNRVERIREVLDAAFAPDALHIDDDSAAHAGHAGAAGGHGHFRVDIVSARFAGLAPLARHRAIYAALEAMLKTDIHALSIRARTPDEAQAGERA